MYNINILLYSDLERVGEEVGDARHRLIVIFCVNVVGLRGRLVVCFAEPGWHSGVCLGVERGGGAQCFRGVEGG